MKKAKISSDIHQKQGHELSKKLYRTISEQSKALDDARSCARTINDLFAPNLQIRRRKFCDYCERLIFSDTALYGKKGEELLWRKGFYDVVATAKKLKKCEYSQDEICNINTHINAGVGFYHHFLAKIQSEFGVDSQHIIDFPLNSSHTKDGVKSEDFEWALLSIHQCLIYLGDLNRYRLEVDTKMQPTLAFRYYLQAIVYKPDHGMAHNQMGTLAMAHNKMLDTVYHYMRCLGCAVSFEGSTNNLHSLFDKNSKYLEELPLEGDDTDNSLERGDHLKRFIARFLLLIDIWYFDKTKVTKVYNLCHQTCKDLAECLSHQSKSHNESCESPTFNELLESDEERLSNDMIFKLIVICLMCISKLQKLNSNQSSTAVAFTLGIYSQLIKSVTNHIQDSVLNYPLPDVDVKIDNCNGVVEDLLRKNRSKSKLRRRKAVAKIESDSDASEHELCEDSDHASSDSDSFVSDAENVLAESSDDDDEHCKNQSATHPEIADKRVDVVVKIKRMDVNDMLEIITEESALQSIKILNDWLMQDTDILKSCGKNTGSLLHQITDLLNVINTNLKSPKLTGVTLNIDDVIKREEKIPLSEDVILKGSEILTLAQKNLDWKYTHKHGPTAKEETVIRIVKLMAFGRFLTNIDETGIKFDDAKNIFVCSCDTNEGTKSPTAVVQEIEMHDSDSTPTVIANKLDGDDTEDNSKGQLMKMKHMGQLWLASEVKALENRVKGKTSLSPYLVLDADALIKYTFMVKHLVNSRKFIVLIPSAVVSALDDLKREQSEARDAIRWLESQFHHGNRFFRAQRPQEKASIPFIKYPKKRDKEMCTYIEIVECCHYLAEQQKGASNLVTLLIGNQNLLTNGENKDFSYVGLAKSAGVSIESIAHFYGKWKKTFKGKR